MSVYLAVVADTGMTLFATLERLSDGFFWNNTAGAWQNAPAAADRKITLTAGSGANVGSYTATKNGLGDAGVVRVRIHNDNDAADKVIAGEQIVVWNSEEVDGTEIVTLQTSVDAIQATASILTTGRVLSAGPLAPNNDLTIVVGDDYNASDGRSLTWTGATANVWPDLTGATITLNIGDGILSVTGSVVTPTGTQQVRAQPTAAQTGTLTAGTFAYDVKATLSSGRVATLVRGKCTVVDTEAS